MTDGRIIWVEPPSTPGASVRLGPCSLVRLREHADERGVLAVTETGGDLPFVVERCFFIRDVPDGARRGGHSLARSSEMMIAMHGSVTVDVDDGETWWRVVLDVPTLALHVPTGVWSEEHSFSPDAVLMVLASHVHDPHEFDRERPRGGSGG